MRRWLWFGLFAIEMLYLSSRKYASALRVLPPSHCAKSTIFHSKQTLFFRKGLFDGFGRGLTTLNVENLLNGKKVSKSLDGPDGEIVASPAKKEPESIRFRCNPPPVSYVLNSTHVIFTVYGEPMALARHRASKFGIMYNPCAKFQKQFLTACTPYLPTVPHPGPIVATINFYLARPKNHYGSGKNAHILKKNAPSWPSKRLGTYYFCFLEITNSSIIC